MIPETCSLTLTELLICVRTGKNRCRLAESYSSNSRIAADMTDPDRLSQIETLWSMVYRANRPEDDQQGFAQAELLGRYGAAIQRYLHGALRDASAADDLYQEFAVRFLRGDFARAHQEKGRFRGFLKVILGRMVADHFRKNIRHPTHQLDSQILIPDESTQEKRDQEFASVWRDQMLTQAWQKLAEEEQQSGKPWMKVLKFRVDHPTARSAELAELLAAEIGEPVTATRLRVLLHRSREKFADYLISAVAQTLQDDSIDAVEEELAELELLRYCQASINQRREG
jgi:DNA-directed RNA polymerase specialized sigma24 family protein